MSQFYEYKWESINPSELGFEQEPVLDQKLDLTRSKHWQSSLSQVNLINHGSIRKVVLQSASNLSGVTFRITGRQNGIQLSENTVGPNANYILSVNYYDIIFDITPIAGVINPGETVLVSLDLVGYMPIIILNTSRNTGLQPWAVSFVTEDADFTYHMFLSLKDCTGKNTYANLIANHNVLEKVLPAQVENQQLQLLDSAVNVFIEVRANPNNTTLKFQFFQPSI